MMGPQGTDILLHKQQKGNTHYYSLSASNNECFVQQESGIYANTSLMAFTSSVRVMGTPLILL